MEILPKDVEKDCNNYAKQNNINYFFQSNIEGELINQIQNSREDRTD